ncbi:patatin [Fulvitalea axinellae]|uniref:Patatin n=1 Tax=Fulvitalea axinellae TaxID=1182444 RepID=A0AAU9D492_9BACT|nr:patatin [Fulvitalea axinellae]
MYKNNLILLVLAFLPLLSFSQKKRQTVGVVLSGGGMKGVAHAGVLKALEERNIPIDYITGTSMGAVVGGMYASGMSPLEIVQYLKDDKFQEWLSGVYDRKYDFLYAAEDDTPSWASFSVALDSTFRSTLGSGLAKDVALNYVLTEKTARASSAANYDFDSLMVPFAATASEIFTQKPVVLRKGSLSKAIRASITVPVVFRPIRVNGQYYFDGGVYNNFPVDLCRKLYKPDVVIGVNVSSKTFKGYPYGEDEQLLGDVLMFAFLDRSDPDAVGADGIYIAPDLGDYTAMDVAAIPAILDSGYVAAQKKMPEILEKITARRTCEETGKIRNEFLKKSEPLVFSGVRYKGFTKNEQRFVHSFFKKRKRATLYLSDIKEGFNSLVSIPYFANTYPDIKWDPDSEAYKLVLEDNSKRDLSLQAGGAVNLRASSIFYLGLKLTHFDGVLSRHTADVYTGRIYNSVHYHSRFYMPSSLSFYVQPFFTLNKWDYSNALSLIGGSNGDSPLLVRQDEFIGLELGAPLGLKYKAGFKGGYLRNRDQYSYLRRFVDEGQKMDLHVIEGKRFGVFVKRNTYDRKAFPKEGTKMRFGLDYYGTFNRYYPGLEEDAARQAKNVTDWFRLQFRLEQFIPMSKTYTLGYLAQADFSTDHTFPDYNGTLINTPGFYPTEDSKLLFLNDFHSPNFVAGGLRNALSFGNNFQWRVDGYVFAPLESVKFNKNFKPKIEGDIFRHIRLSAGTTFLYQTPIGPISATYNYYDDPGNEHNFFLSFGYFMFRRSALD